MVPSGTPLHLQEEYDHPKNFQQAENLNNLENPKTGNVLHKFSSYLSDSAEENEHFWNAKIPSRKRSKVVHKKKTPMKRFHKQLLGIMKHEGTQIGSSSEEVLLEHKVSNFIPSNEIGLGCILLKPDHTTV
ncbi:hypothetical protein RJT34_04305 [Clitoria ternatea]|uniref:Uncharacterized protein n=1 Tax=Clitoria ternatea TaxID=43366 RepID=A0AAN9KNT8_CLITE